MLVNAFISQNLSQLNLTEDEAYTLLHKATQYAHDHWLEISGIAKIDKGGLTILPQEMLSHIGSLLDEETLSKLFNMQQHVSALAPSSSSAPPAETQEAVLSGNMHDLPEEL